MHSFVQRLLRQSHFWRTIGFIELSELYASRILRILAMQMIGGFVTIFLYQEGYSLLFIALFFTLYFFTRGIFAVPSGFIIARYGPKHGTLFSNLLFIPGMIALTLTPEYGLWALGVFLVLNGFSRTLYEVCHLVNFSKVKHAEHAGKEIGIMQILDRITAALSPLLGGLIAFWFGPQVMIIVATIVLTIAAGPLFYTAEPVRTHQKITFRGFNWRKTWRNIVASVALGVDFNLSGFMWYLFIFIVVLGAGGNEAYVQIGALGSVTLLSALITSYVFGRVIDRRKGGALLRYSVITTSFLHFVRPFVQTPGSVAAMNVANEVTTTGYYMPFLRGLFDTADSLPGYRIIYMVIVIMAVSLGDTIAVAVLALLVFLLGDVEGFKMSYMVLAPVVLLIAFHGFSLYKKRSIFAKLARV